MTTKSTPAPNERSVASESGATVGVRRDSVSFRAGFVAGAKAISPILPAGATVGLVTGVAATAVGLPPLQATAMSVIVYSPTVMLTAFELLESGTPAVIVVGTALIVGVRFTMLSLSIAPYFKCLSTRWKWLLAYFLWTPVYAVSLQRFDADPTTSKRGYWLGAALPLWVTFQIALVAGIAFSARVPATWQLEFVVPLAFIALLMRFLKDRPTKSSAIVAGVLAVLGVGLPVNLGIVVATLGGITVGMLANSREGSA